LRRGIAIRHWALLDGSDGETTLSPYAVDRVLGGRPVFNRAIPVGLSFIQRAEAQHEPEATRPSPGGLLPPRERG